MSWPFDRDFERGFERGFVNGAEFGVHHRLIGDRRDFYYHGGHNYNHPYYQRPIPAPVYNEYNRGYEVLPAMVAIPRRGDCPPPYPRFW